MKLLRYRTPSVRGMLGITKLIRRSRSALGLNKVLYPFRAVGYAKRRAKRLTGYYSVNRVLKGKVPTPFGIRMPRAGRRTHSSPGGCVSLLLVFAVIYVVRGCSIWGLGPRPDDFHVLPTWNGGRVPLKMQLRCGYLECADIVWRRTDRGSEGQPVYVYGVKLWVGNNTGGPQGPRVRVTLWDEKHTQSLFNDVADSRSHDQPAGQWKSFAEDVSTSFPVAAITISERE